LPAEQKREINGYK